MMKAILLFSVVLVLAAGSVDAQTETRQQVADRIDLGVKYLSEKKYTKSIEELITAKEAALQNGWYPQAFNATLNIGTNYFLMLDYGESFQYYLQAYDISIKHLEPRHEMLVFNNIGVLYIEEKDQAKAKESFFKAYEIAKKTGDESSIATYGINLALVLNKIGDLDEAEFYIEEAMPLLEDNANILAKTAQAENLFLRGNYREAEKIALKILPKSTNLSLANEQASVNDEINILMLLSQIYEQKREFGEAKKYALLARSAQNEIEARADIYNQLANLFSKTEEFQKALRYKDSVIIATDSLYAVKNSALFKSEKVKYQIQNYRHELLESKKLLQREKQFFYTVLFFVVLIMGFLIWIYKNNSLKHKQQKKIIELELAQEKSNYLLNEKQHREKETMALLEKERLKNELDNKNRELTAKAMYLASKNELIEEIVQSLSQNNQIESNTSLKNQINDLKKHLKKDPQWDGFFTHFEELNQGFLDRLRAQHPKLTPNDIRFLAFLYMNLSYKEIASLLNITPESCRKRKERISKKMDLPDDLPLHSYLSAI